MLVATAHHAVATEGVGPGDVTVWAGKSDRAPVR
jgi:hypothetical protein